MALAFSHCSIVVKRESVARVIGNKLIDDENLLAVANNLVDGDFGDDYLIGIESMNGNLSDEFQMLQRLGLHWNDGKDCMDFFIPSDGAATATWLKYERVKHAGIYYSVYAHSEDASKEIVSYDGLLNSSSVSSSVLLDRRHWGTVARDELNRLYRPSLLELLNEATCNGRVCPIPKLWNELHEIAVEADINDSTPPPLPLILGGWFYSENSEKSKRLMELLHWTCQNNVGDVVWAYLKCLDEGDWHHSDE
jgi:hypothetical protein